VNPEDLFWLALVVVLLFALGIGAGIRSNLAALTAELDALRQLLDSRLRPGVDKDDIDAVTRLAATLFEEKRGAHKCPECGALPAFKTGREAFGEDKRAAGAEDWAYSSGGGYWHYPYHLGDCSLLKPGSMRLPRIEEE
jgi:hypothetical protein